MKVSNLQNGKIIVCMRMLQVLFGHVALGKLPLRMPLYGYDRTAHSKRSQETKGSTWAPFLPSDCA
jgi:hypothetical protein